MKGDLTQGNIWKQLIYFAFPLLLGNIFQQLYNTVDSIVVGNAIGKSALAAVGASTPLINLLVSFFGGLALGATVLIAQAFGAKDDERVEKAVHTAIAFSLVAGILLTILGSILSAWILEMMGTPMNIMEGALVYLKIYFYGTLPLMVYNMGSGLLRAVGDSKRPLYILMFSSIINIVLDLVFVLVFHMGIAGVALATTIAQTISAVLTVCLLMISKESYRLNLFKIRFDGFSLIQMIRIGLPSGLQNAVVSFSNVVVQSNINLFGELAIAGCSSYTKIDGFAILPAMSMSMALTTFTGQNVGANRLDRVKEGLKVGMVLTTGIIVLVSILLMIFAPNILSVFNQDEMVIYYGTYMMRTVVPAYIFLAMTHAFAGVLRGMGKTTIPMIIMVFCWCFVRIAWLKLAMPIFNDIIVVFLGYSLTWILSFVISALYFKIIVGKDMNWREAKA